MTSPNLANLAKTGQLKAEPATAEELRGLLQSGADRLRDSKHEELSFASRFDLAYNAAHALALLALRKAGYRSDNRYLVFQCLEHTVGMRAAQWRVLAKAHHARNVAEYEGHLESDEGLLREVIAIADDLRDALQNSPG